MDGRVVAAAHEERFSRQKHDAEFPAAATRFCLDKAGVTAAELDQVVYYEQPLKKFDRILWSTEQSYPASAGFFQDALYSWFRAGKFDVRDRIVAALGVPAEKITFIDHHDAHMAAAFFGSDFERATVVTIDGVGEGRNRAEVRACAAMCDIDHFKRVNDTYGHQAGDAVLRRVGQALQDGVRPNDRVYRYGGEEFLVYLAGASIDEAAGVCERLRQSVEQLSVDVSSSDQPVVVTASFGISEATKGLTIDDVVTRCDLALYAAKNNGRNRVYLWQKGELVESTHGVPLAA
ncbi:MAG: diguanylate cyclase [Alphaproteobacteria bacterium]